MDKMTSIGDLILELAGPGRDHARLARLLGITEASAYGWIAMASKGDFKATTSVRGDINRIAKAALSDAAAARDADDLSIAEVERYLRERVSSQGGPQSERPQARDAQDIDRAALRRGLEFAISQLDDGVSTELVVNSIKTVLITAGGDD